MASSEAGSSSDAARATGGDYQVYLSFRGPHTRFGFPEVLYHGLVAAGVRVFMDEEEEELRVGEVIDENIRHAVDNSLLYIPIFSRDYASSVRCLRELTYIIKTASKSGGQKKISPIFYDVNPIDVRLRTPVYIDALLKHKTRTFPDEFNAWRAALAEVGEIMGWIVKDWQSQEVIVKLVIKEVLEKLEMKQSMEKIKDEAGQRPEDLEISDRNYAIAAVQNIVGIDGRVEQITDLLEMEVNDEVRILGIFGTDGFGKTTLAKAVYDRISCCFDNRSFLAEVEETTQDPRGIQFLETKLIHDVLKRDCEDPSFHERIFRNMKVLLVVDDVEDKSHLHAIVGDQLHRFGPGSRIIVTSENEEILKEYDPAKVRTYRVGKMDDGQAFELFCEHAFRMQSSIPDYDGVANRIVNATGKLPLAVEVVGSFLRGKSIQEWAKMEESMKERARSSRKATVGLEEILDICCKELDQQQKDIFLDIACFISGRDARIASFMWPSSYRASSGCILMPLAKIGENNEFQMHRLLRRLGKRISKKEESQEPSPRRFCTQDMVLKAMKRETRVGNVEALCFDFAAGDFQSMPDIRFLKLDNAKFSGDFAGAFASLRWLCWQRCPQEFDAENLVLRELAILELPWGEIRKDWRGWRKIKMPKLKVLNLTGCSKLRFIPDFSGYKDLEILILEGCSRLVELGPSSCHLKCLVSLNLKFCSGLDRLPPEVSDMTALSELSLDGASFAILPNSLRHLLKLRLLSLRDCRRLCELTYSIGEMGSLEELDISGTLIRELPASIGNLQNLRVLRMDHSCIKAFPGEIGNLTKLEELHASWCWNFRGPIPGDIGRLHHLRSLMLGHSRISSLPLEISTIPHLHTLDLIQCNEIEELPKLPPSLIRLHVSSERLKATPLLEGLKELEELCLSDGNLEVRRPPSKQLTPESNVIDEQSFSISFPKLRKLELSLSQVIKLKFGPTDIGQLKRLKITHAGSSRKEVLELPKALSLLKLYDSPIEEIEGIEGLEALKRLDISNCRIRNLDGISQLTSLRSLILSDCDWLSSLDVSKLKSLKVLEIRRCKMIRQIEGFDNLTSLVKLNISECPAEISVQSMEELEDEAGQPPVDVETSDGKCTITPVQSVVGIDDRAQQITDLMETEVNDESMEKMKDEAGQRPEDMDTSDRNYAIAAVRNIVGIDGRVKQITDLLEMEVNDEVRILGIFGTDGVGKTTLAKAVYDRISSCFDGCSFLAEVKETTQDPHGIKVLETKLVCDILERDREDPSFDERIGDFLDIFRKRKVLLVVDDVEDESHLLAFVGDHLPWFSPGSRIIVTSQNERILEGYDPEKVRTYPVSAWEDGQTFELFCMHAFRMQSSIPDYDGLANRIVGATEKLPLAVEVVGSFLRGKSIQEWARMEKSMKEHTRSSRKTTVGPEEILYICCKELDQLQKDIFLDIACFISGVDARIASHMWPNCHLPSSGCILMPLAKTGENNELLMHRLLRCLGKRICKQGESQDPRSIRFCTQDMVLKAMNREKGMGNVEALCLDFTAGDFQSMPKIRFLKLDNARFYGNFAGAFASLRWLCWQRCPPEFDAENLDLRELAILELPRGKITEDWGGWSKIKMPKLKVLNLTRCSDLLFTPNFSGSKDLEILILEGCSRLVKLDPSIGHLKHLVSLNLKSCSRLNSLPVEMGGMTALKELFIDGTSVWQIPISIGNLKKLEILRGFQCFPLTQLPRSICYLTALSELSFDGAEITELPSSLGDLLKLRRLSLRNCRYLEELPDSIGNMGSSLEELDISATCISELPDSIRNLESLKVLRMDYSFVRAFPGEIGNLTKLEELHASWCRSLKGAVPCDIKRLHHLRSLTLGHSSISSLPSEISTLSSLHTLDLLQCNEIEVLPELPSSLIRLRVSSKRMKAMPLLKDLKELEELCLSNEDPEERRPLSERPMPESDMQHPFCIWFTRLWNPEFLQTKRIDKQSFLISFPKLRKLEWSLSQIIKLKFEPTDIPQLKTLTVSGLSLKEVSELPKTLSVFEIYHSAIEEIEGLEGLGALRRLEISNCNIQHLNGIGQLTSLRSLILSDCDDLDSLPNLSNLQSLKVLEIRRCKMIRQIEGLEKLTSLQKLNISECPAENTVEVQKALDVMARSTAT